MILNKFATMQAFGTFRNSDATLSPTSLLASIITGNSLIANAIFDRNVQISGNLNMGIETNNEGVYTRSGGNITCQVNGVTYSLTPAIISYLSTLTSNAQTQFNTINSNYTTLFTNYSNLNADVVTMNTTIGLLYTGYNSLLSSNSTLSSNYTNLNNTVTSLNSSVSTLTTNYDNISSTVSSLSSNVSNLSSNFSSLNNAVFTMSGNIQGITYDSGITSVDQLKITGLLNIDGSSGIKLSSTTTLSPAILAYVDATSSIQNQLNSKQPLLTSTTDLTLQSLTLNGDIDLKTNYIRGGNSQVFPTTNSGTKAGLGVFWNNPNGYGNSVFLNYAQNGIGGYAFYTSNNTNAPSLLMNLDNNGNLTASGNVVIPSAKKLDITGSDGIKVNSTTTVSPTTLSYLDATSSIQTQLTTNASNIATNTSNISSLQTQVTANTNAINSINSSTNISALQTQVNTNTSDISTLQTQVATNTTSIGTINTNWLAMAGDIGILNSYNLGNVVANTSGITNTSGETNIDTLNITTLLNLTGSNGLKLNSTTTLPITMLANLVGTDSNIQTQIDTTNSILGALSFHVDNINDNVVAIASDVTGISSDAGVTNIVTLHVTTALNLSDSDGIQLTSTDWLPITTLQNLVGSESNIQTQIDTTNTTLTDLSFTVDGIQDIISNADLGKIPLHSADINALQATTSGITYNAGVTTIANKLNCNYNISSKQYRYFASSATVGFVSYSANQTIGLKYGTNLALNSVTAYNGATASAYTGGVFTAEVDGFYLFELNMFFGSTSTTAPVGRYIQFLNPTVTSPLYCNFNQAYVTTEGSLKTIQSCYMTAGQTAWFRVGSGTISIMVGNNYSNLTITKLH